jgi:hypothetical protein
MTKLLSLTIEQAARAFDYYPTEVLAKNFTAHIIRQIGEPDELGGYQLTEQLKQAIDDFFDPESGLVLP